MRRIDGFLLAICTAAWCGAAEPPGGQPPRVDPAQLVRQFDTDGDGRLGRGEAPPRMQSRWDQIDTDRDGFVTVDELKARDARVAGMGGPESGGLPPSDGARREPGDRSAPAGTGPAATTPAASTDAGLALVVIGSGSPQYDPGRAGPSALIRHGGRAILVDMGNGTQARLHEAGVSVRDLAALALTHHHLDHTEEFIPVLVQAMLRGGSIEIAGPPGTAKAVAFAREFYAEDMAYRMGRRGRTAADLGQPAVREVRGGESFELGGLRVTTAKVNHSIETVAYRFEADGRSIVVSGDLTYSEGLVALARGADVLLIDAGGAPVRAGRGDGAEGAAGRAGGGGGGGDPSHAHASREEVGRMAKEAGVATLVLTHIAGGEVDEAATKAALGEVYKGEVLVARDLLEVVPGAHGAKAAGAASAVTASPRAAPAQGSGGRACVNAANARGRQDGTSWATAFATVQAALNSGAAEIWVARGTYKPTEGNDRSATFQLRPGVALYGGFAGGETQLAQRDWARHATVLSGDIGREGEPSDNVQHVVTGADDAILDGFTITGGYAVNAGRPGMAGGPPSGPPGGGMGRRGGPGGPDGAGGPPPGGPGGGGGIHTTPDAIMSGANSGSGAGMLNFKASPTVRHCIFEGNQAGKGGAVYNMTSTTFPPRPGPDARAPVFIGCTFRNNTAQGRGGGVSNDLGTSPTFLDCVFEGNRTPQKGGGMYNDFGCSPVLINCLFAGNEAESAAGMGNDGGSSPALEYCTFVANHATDTGPSLYQGTGPASTPVLLRCVVASNRCDWGDSGIYNWHDNVPSIRDSAIDAPAAGDSGYRPGRLAEAQLLARAGELAALRVQPARESPPEAPARVASSDRIVHVRGGGAAHAQDGRTWATAYATLQPAIDDAGRDGATVRVAAGTYTPGGDRSVSFVLRPGVRLAGGFAGGEPAAAASDPARHPTVLDGRGAYHVLVGAAGSSLDGFTITGGCADGAGYDGKGGGLINYRRGPQGRPNSESVAGFSMQLRRCTFLRNRARDGGAVYSYDRAKVAFESCSFAQNEADQGGAVLDRVGVESTFDGCLFTGNRARWRGGAVYLDYGARAVFSGGGFKGNSTGGHGGALFAMSRASQLENTTIALTGCAFDANRADGRGGAVANTDSAILTAARCTFAQNRAGRTGGAVSTFQRGRTTLTECRYTGNAAGTGEPDAETESSGTGAPGPR